MRVFKPRKVGLLFRTVERAQRYHFCVAGLLYVSLDQPRCLLPEAAMWKTVPKILGQDATLDEMVAKTHGEILLAGSVFTPDGAPLPVCVARVQLGPVDKRVAAIGDRQWKRGVPTDPVPFVEMPITWDRAFGGKGFDSNPLGKGIAPIDAPEGRVHPLPNLEHPDRLIRSQGERPTPACFLPLDLTWPERWKKAGTYDRSYLETDFPGLARDADWTMFNAASPDQWAPEHFAGDESFVLENLHPRRRRLEGRLPGAAVRVLVTRKGESPEQPTSIPMRLETIWLFPNVERAVLIYRGVIDVAEDDADDLEHLLIGAEDAAAPKTAAHYRDVMLARLEPTRGVQAMLREEDLLPAWPSEVLPELADDMAAVKVEGFALQNQMRKADRDILRARANAAALGLDPDLHTPKAMPPLRKPGEPAPKAEEMELEIERQKTKALEEDVAKRARKREELAALGFDYGAIEKEADTPPAGPPRPIAKEKLAWLAGLLAEAESKGVPLPDVQRMLEHGPFRARPEQADEAQLDIYRMTAHGRAAAPQLPTADSARLRAEVERRREAGLSLGDLDLTGADLSGVQWPGIDLGRALLECASLRDANLAGANLREAVLTRADLGGATLDGANLEGANLGGCQAEGASLRGCSLQRAVLAKANLSNVRLDEANLSHADLADGQFTGGSWRKVRAAHSLFFRTKLRGLDLSGAELEHANFLEVDASDTNFTEARLVSAGFTRSKADRADFTRAKLEKVAFQLESSAIEANFAEADAPESNFRGTNLDGADFTGARLQASDFSTCSLRGSKFVRADAQRARFVRAHLERADLTAIDLMEGVLQKAHLEGAVLDEANLFQADLSLIYGSPETTSRGANFTRTRVHPLRKKA